MQSASTVHYPDKIRLRVPRGLPDALRLAAKQRAIARITELVGNMTPDQAEKAVDVLQARDDLMELHEPYL